MPKVNVMAWELFSPSNLFDIKKIEIVKDYPE